ncbi:MAG: hypothetical protein QW351_05080, partial [Candidatus Caldarchaeum sp.]
KNTLTPEENQTNNGWRPGLTAEKNQMKAGQFSTQRFTAIYHGMHGFHPASQTLSDDGPPAKPSPLFFLSKLLFVLCLDSSAWWRRYQQMLL